jgi:hypothetical protein
MPKKPIKKISGGKSTRIKTETKGEILRKYETSKASDGSNVLKAMELSNNRRQANDAFNFQNAPPKDVSDKVFKAFKAVGDSNRNIKNERFSNYKSKKKKK